MKFAPVMVPSIALWVQTTKNPAHGARRVGATALGLGTTKVATDAQNKEQDPGMPFIYFCVRSDTTKRPLTSEKKCV